MKSCKSSMIAIGSFCLGLMVAVVLIRGTQQASGASPAGNGDVNCDGKIDVSDGIFILEWLFTGSNPAPCKIECQSCTIPELINISSSAPAMTPKNLIYTVPNDKDFILTYLVAGIGKKIVVWEDTGSNVTNRLNGVLGFNSTTGIRFASGSKVRMDIEIRDCYEPCNTEYTLVGYLIDPESGLFCPSPESTVNISSSAPAMKPLNLVYTVPDDKIFVLTYLVAGIDKPVEAWEDTGTTLIRRLHSVQGFNSTIPGIRFDPGSKVKLNISGTPCYDPCPTDYTLIGYLIDA
jgi:hypothetical protein